MPDDDRSDQPAPPEWLARVCEGTEMGALVLATDWAATPLGPPDRWSMGLRTAVGICLSSRFPMLVAWGPELIKIYNDGYRPLLGADKHPWAMGARVVDVWPEVWDVIGPLFDSVRSTGRATWEHHQHLPLERNGYVEECYFIYSYSALYDDDGSIGGVLDVVTETTEEILSVRRLAALTGLGAALVDTRQVADVCVRAVRALGAASPDVRWVTIHLRVDDELALVASNGVMGEPLADETLRAVADERRAVTLGSLGPERPAVARLLPLGGTDDGVHGVIAIGLNPHRPFDAAYEGFVQLVAATIGAALDGAHRRAVELGEYRRIGDTLQRAMLKPAVDLPTIASRYRPAAGNLAVGGDWYDVIDLDDDRRALVVGDCVGHGLDAATAMSQLRSAARAMLLDSGDPAAVLDGLDLFARSVDGAAFATVVCAVFDRTDGTVTYARAGHPPPLVLTAGGRVWLDRSGGPPLAMRTRGLGRVNSRRRLAPGDLVVLYTDGLVERRGEVIDEGMDRLAQAAEDAAHESVQVIADEILRRLVPDRPTDDVVLVVKRLPPAGDAVTS